MNTTTGQGLNVSAPPPLSASLVPSPGVPLAPAGEAGAAAAPAGDPPSFEIGPPPVADESMPCLPGSDGPSVPAFPRVPGETPRAFGAFKVFFELGHARSLPAVADQLHESLSTVKKWSGRYQWFKRIADFEAGLLQQQAEARLADSREHAADWIRRAREWRELEWESARKIRAAAQCFLDSFGDQQVEKMTLGQASRAVQIAARLARLALSDAAPSAAAAPAPIQLEIEAALKKTFGARTDVTESSPASSATLN